MRSLKAVRGTSLAELLLVLILSSVLGALVGPIVIGSSRLAWRTRLTLAEERDATALSALANYDLRAARLTRTAVTSTTELRYDRPVGEAPVCSADASGVVVPHDAWRGPRLPEAGRDFLHALVDPVTSRWVDSPIRSVVPHRCPDGAAAWRIDVVSGPVVASWVRIGEPVRAAVYPGGDTTWLGLAGVLGGGTIQPFAGPVSAGELEFSRIGSRLEMRLSSPHLSPITLALPLELGP